MSHSSSSSSSLCIDLLTKRQTVGTGVSALSTYANQVKPLYNPNLHQPGQRSPSSHCAQMQLTLKHAAFWQCKTMQSPYKASFSSILLLLTSLARCASAGISTVRSCYHDECTDSGGSSHLDHKTVEKKGEKQGFSVLFVSCHTLSE